MPLDHSIYLPYFADIPMIPGLFPDNSTINFLENHNTKMLHWKALEIDKCSISKEVSYHPKLRPAIEISTDVHYGAIQKFGLVFSRQRLRFVSCHNNKAHWIDQLKRLIEVFDIHT